MRNIFTLFFAFVCFNAVAQRKINVQLKRQLDSVFVLDQKYREIMMVPAKRDSVAKALSLTPKEVYNYSMTMAMKADTSNIIFVEGIIKKYGYPGKTLVGDHTDEAVWNVIQHSHTIPQYLPLIKAAAEANELPFYLYATMYDRYLLNHAQAQVYGSQVQSQKLKNCSVESFVWPIKDAASVNERRKKAGFDLTVEQNAKRLGVTYRIVTLDEIK